MPRHNGVIKPNTEDPTWTYPWASRKHIQRLEEYFTTFHLRPRGWHRQKRDDARVFRQAQKIPWESVAPHLRDRCQQLFNRKIAEEKSKGIPGWPSAGKIRSIRCNCAMAARWMWTGLRYMNYSHYQQDKKAWLKYQAWKAQQERHGMNNASLAHKFLEVGL